MEKQYIFWDTGKGCLFALGFYSAAAVVLAGLFFVIPESTWLHVLLSLAVFAVVAHYVNAGDENTKRNKK
ncbi:hypothetical protein [Kaarinaea lacus]